MSECQTVKILIEPNDFVGPDLGPNRLPPFTCAWLNFFTFDGHRNVNLLIRKIFKDQMCVLIFPQNMMFLHFCLTI